MLCNRTPIIPFLAEYSTSIQKTRSCSEFCLSCWLNFAAPWLCGFTRVNMHTNTWPRAHNKHTSSNTNYEDSSLILFQRRGMRGMRAVKEWRRIDGKQGGTGKVIKNSSYRCFWSTSKWCACQCQRRAWCIIEMVPTWHLALTSHPRSTWQHVSHVGDTVGHTSPQQPSSQRDEGHQGKRHTCSTPDLKGTKLGHVQFVNLASWIKSEQAGNVLWSIAMHFLFLHCFYVE